MKKIFLGIYGAALLISGCKENNPVLTYSSYNFIDTSYVVASVPVAQPHNVLIEEFTGQSCPNCPDAHTTLENLITANPGRVNAIAMYINTPQAIPPSGSHVNLMDTGASTTISNNIYSGIHGLPSGGIDRFPWADVTIQPGPSSWGDKVAYQLPIPNPINLSVLSSFNATTNQATVISTISYTQSISGSQFLSMVVVEDSITGYQEFPFGVIDSNYIFTNVFRGMITQANGIYGDPIISGMPTKPKGETDVRTYTYTLPVKTPAINPAHCHIVAFLTRADKTVIQSVQCRLMP